TARSPACGSAPQSLAEARQRAERGPPERLDELAQAQQVEQVALDLETAGQPGAGEGAGVGGDGDHIVAPGGEPGLWAGPAARGPPSTASVMSPAPSGLSRVRKVRPRSGTRQLRVRSARCASRSFASSWESRAVRLSRADLHSSAVAIGLLSVKVILRWEHHG